MKPAHELPRTLRPCLVHRELAVLAAALTATTFVTYVHFAEVAYEVVPPALVTAYVLLQKALKSRNIETLVLWCLPGATLAAWISAAVVDLLHGRATSFDPVVTAVLFGLGGVPYGLAYGLAYLLLLTPLFSALRDTSFEAGDRVLIGTGLWLIPAGVFLPLVESVIGTFPHHGCSLTGVSTGWRLWAGASLVLVGFAAAAYGALRSCMRRRFIDRVRHGQEPGFYLDADHEPHDDLPWLIMPIASARVATLYRSATDQGGIYRSTAGTPMGRLALSEESVRSAKLRE